MKKVSNILIFRCILVSLFGAILVTGVVIVPMGSGETIYNDRMAVVERVVDGDTIVIEGGERVRYIGVDTPESKHPGRPVESLAKEAAEFNRSLVEGRRVFLLMGVEPRDKFGRLLAYVFVDDIFVNARLLRAGYARESAYSPNVRFRPLFKALQDQARSQGVGIWGLE